MPLTSNNLTSRMERVQSPIIPTIAELIRQTPGTISLGQGVVNYPPPERAIALLTEFLSQPKNHQYRSVTGIPDLISEIAKKLETENKIEINNNNSIVVTAGSNMAFLNAILAITNGGDEIILNTPYYFNHEMAITMANCRPVLVATDKNYQLNLDAIASAITNKTKAIVTISPNNPTGAVYPEADLKAVNQLCRDRGIYHISDEAYEYFTYDNIKHISPASFPNSATHTISLFSLSKAYGFASWRIGYMAIPKHLLTSIKKVQDTNLICPPVVSQYAALGALRSGYAYCRPYIQEIAKVRKNVSEKLNSLADICKDPSPGVSPGACAVRQIAPANGAFYFFLKIDTSKNDLEIVKQLIKNYRVAVIPGSTFGITGGCYLRVAYGALQLETATEGISRLITGLRQIV